MQHTRVIADLMDALELLRRKPNPGGYLAEVDAKIERALTDLNPGEIIRNYRPRDATWVKVTREIEYRVLVELDAGEKGGYVASQVIEVDMPAACEALADAVDVGCDECYEAAQAYDGFDD